MMMMMMNIKYIVQNREREQKKKCTAVEKLRVPPGFLPSRQYFYVHIAPCQVCLHRLTVSVPLHSTCSVFTFHSQVSTFSIV